MTARPVARSLKRLDKTHLADHAALAIKRLIATGTHPPGSKLPTEAVLAEDLGVTRLTVREALVQLEAAGLVTTRHGSGTFVTDFENRITLRLRTEMLEAGRNLTTGEAVSLMQFRAVVVDAFGPQIAANASPEDTAELRTIVASERAALGHPEELAELDYRFNEVLARASQNEFFPMLMRSMQEIHVHLGAVIFRELGDDEAVLKAQDAVITALESRSPPKVRRALEVYLGGGTTIVERWLTKATKTRRRAEGR